MNNETAVFRSLEDIENRITEKLTVGNLANNVYFSKYHYGRLFRETVGDSVMEYVTKRKLTLAGRVLLETDSTVLDIALDFGFDSHEGFTRSFKAYMGVTPTNYRKYNLTAITQKTVKERSEMTYSKTTDEIIRELNDFIVKARETANSARKGELPEYTPFWNKIADATDAHADKVKNMLTRIANIAERPDEITNRFAIIKVIEEIAFHSNLLAFNAGLTVSRGQPEDVRTQWHLCEKYLELARTSVLKTEKIVRFFNELSALVFADMRKYAAEKIQTLVDKGKSTADSVVGFSYIKHEFDAMMNALSATLYDKTTVSELEEYLFRLNIISFTAEMDIPRNPEHKAFFDNMTAFKSYLAETVDFFRTLVLPENNPAIERTTRKRFLDIAFQGNVLLFYTKGELSDERLGCLLSSEQKAVLDEICSKIDGFIQFTHQSTDETAYKQIADRLYDIHTDMTKEADNLKEHGGAVRFLANEFKGLANGVMKM